MYMYSFTLYSNIYIQKLYCEFLNAVHTIATLVLLSRAPLLFLFPDDEWFSWQHKSFLQGMLKTLPSPFRISDKCRGDIHREQNIWSARFLSSITPLPLYHLISLELHYKPRQVHHRWLSRELADKGFYIIAVFPADLNYTDISFLVKVFKSRGPP